MTGEIRTIADGLAFGEGPRWHDGALYLSDMHTHRVLRIREGQGTEIVAQHHAPLSGLGWLPDGRMLVVSMHEQRVLCQESDGVLVLHADLSQIATGQTNDMVVAEDGTAYVGNFGFVLHPMGEPRTAKLACVSPTGDVSVAADELWFANGIAMTPDGKALIVAESFAMRLTAFDIGPSGTLSNRRIWAELGAGKYPDGICLDAEGAAWVALPSSGEMIRVREGGEVVETVTTGRMAIACALGGQERKTLFMLTAESGVPEDCRANHTAQVLATEVSVAGVDRP